MIVARREEAVAAQDQAEAQAERRRAGRLALAAGLAVFAAKLSAFFTTGSTAVLADAMESTVNIVSAALLVYTLRIAARPPDPDHPYGHGKAEFLSAGIEGAAIAFAALVIVAEGVRELLAGPELRDLDVGLVLLVLATVANGLLGRHLVSVGTRLESAALVADGRHVLADVWTSVGVVGGLVVVALTGWMWADPLLAIAVGVHVASQGMALLRNALGGLMDEADPGVNDDTAAALEAIRRDAWIDLHGLRSWRSGARRHFDFHLTVPRFYDVEQIHGIHDEIEDALLTGDGHGSDVVVHFDPCAPADCPECSLADCSVRSTAFEARPPFTGERAARTDAALASDRTRDR